MFLGVVMPGSRRCCHCSVVFQIQPVGWAPTSPVCLSGSGEGGTEAMFHMRFPLPRGLGGVVLAVTALLGS